MYDMIRLVKWFTYCVIKVDTILIFMNLLSLLAYIDHFINRRLLIDITQ